MFEFKMKLTGGSSVAQKLAQQEDLVGSGTFLCGVSVLSPPWCGFPSDALVSSHSPKTHAIG